MFNRSRGRRRSGRLNTPNLDSSRTKKRKSRSSSAKVNEIPSPSLSSSSSTGKNGRGRSKTRLKLTKHDRKKAEGDSVDNRGTFGKNQENAVSKEFDDILQDLEDWHKPAVKSEPSSCSFREGRVDEKAREIIDEKMKEALNRKKADAREKREKRRQQQEQQQNQQQRKQQKQQQK